MTIHEAASLIRAARHPRSELERDLAISRLTIALARDMASKNGGDALDLALTIAKMVKREAP